MGWYLRKSFGFGPLRLNLSKSGIGYSVGVRGARIGVGPRGEYVRLGRGGVYYQKYLNPSGTVPARQHVPSPPTSDALAEQVPVTTAQVSALHDATSESLLSEIQQKYDKARLAPIAAVFAFLLIVALLVANAPLWVTISLIPLLSVVHGVLALHDYEGKVVALNYELDADAQAHYVEFLNAIQAFAGSSRIWRITSRQYGVDRKYHGGANTLLDKKVISLRTAHPSGLQTQIAVWALPLSDQTLYFFPDRVLVYQGRVIGAVSYETLSVRLEQTRFVEADGVPSDAQIVDQTWRYVNKNGTPDRRFSNNRQIPVVLYPQLGLSSSTGLNIVLESSNLGKAATFKAGIDKYSTSRK